MDLPTSISFGAVAAAILVSLQNTVMPLSWIQKQNRRQSMMISILCTLGLSLFMWSDQATFPNFSRVSIFAAACVYLFALKQKPSAWSHRRIFPIVVVTVLSSAVAITMINFMVREILLGLNFLAAIGHIRHIHRENSELSDNYRDLTQRLMTLEAGQRSIGAAMNVTNPVLTEQKSSVARDKSQEAS